MGWIRGGDRPLVTTSKENGVEAIYTQNLVDFERFGVLTVENLLIDYRS